MAGIYLHIPFCAKACHYCDFHFSTNTKVKEEMVRALAQELQLQKNYLGGEQVETIYFGGGTPSILDRRELSFLLNTIAANFPVVDEAEITIEANPDDLTTTYLNDLFAEGINRLSIGIQSFDNSTLSYLNRIHDQQTAIDSIVNSRVAGFKNISIDLIYSIPTQGNVLWSANVEQAIALSPEHISAYSLTIEPGTVFGNWQQKGRLTNVTDDVAAGQMEILIERLEAAGYEQYEVSNFSKPNFHSRHNSSYWMQKKYLGVGPSAHSYNGTSRQFNVRNNHMYISSISSGRIPFELESLSIDDHVNEYLLTTLRTKWGSDLQFLKSKYGVDILGLKSAYIDLLIQQQLATIDNNSLRLSRKGKFLADKITSDLFLTPVKS
jgi:oxygen-independent coproporphyrinogen III oxidase